MPDEPAHPHSELVKRSGERRNGDRRCTPRPGDRRRWQRRGRKLATAGIFLSALGVSGLPQPAHRLLTGLRGAAVPIANTHRIELPTSAYVKLPSGFRDQQDFFIEPATNESVQEAIRMYSGWAGFAEALGRGGRYLQTFQDILVKEGVLPELAYLALVESEFKTDARSWASAFGIWQFMPATGERFGLEQNAWIDERGDPIESAKAAAKYLRFLNVAARCLNTDVEGVLDLNPELKRRVTPLDGEFVLKVPAGRGADVQQCLDRLPPNQRVRIHVVERGQTLSSVAHLYNTRPSRLAEVNALSPKRKLPKGYELVIPLEDED